MLFYRYFDEEADLTYHDMQKLLETLLFVFVFAVMLSVLLFLLCRRFYKGRNEAVDKQIE